MEIKNNQVQLILTQARGRIRIADKNGNHISKPASEGKNLEENYVEWMITNQEIGELAKSFLIGQDKKSLIETLLKINQFVWNSKYATREALKTTSQKIDKFVDFDIYHYTENFYSFEKEISSKIKIKITFKMGDYTLAPHMFVLLPFGNSSLKLKNLNGEIKREDFLGSVSMGLWSPTKEDIKEIVISLSHASERHRNDLVQMIKQ